MEARMKKYNQQVSPERSKVWKEKSPKYHQNRKVPVVYYLCRNSQLEHPHFMEVPLSSPDGLYLRDVIGKLNALRGRGMASLYSWSCKRSYKNGFVWHDLCEDDLILPARGSEYVLKGSELFDESNSDRFSPISNVKVQSLNQSPEPVSFRSHDEASSSSSLNGKETRNSQEDELSPEKHIGSFDVSPKSSAGKSGPLNLPSTEYKIYSKTEGLADASTQTEENVNRPNIQKTCTRGVSTDDGSSEPECNGICEAEEPRVKDNSEICRDCASPPTSTSSPSSSGGKTETLESLIRADVSKMNSFRIPEDDGIRMPTNTRLKAWNLLMQLISCGSISVKNHSFGLIPSYKAKFSDSKFPSPLFSNSIMLREFDCLAENPKATSLRLEDKEYFSGSLVESKILKEEGDGHNVLKRSSSYNADRTCKELKPQDIEGSSSAHSECILRSVKASLTKQPKSESMRSVSDGPRNSMDRIESSSTSPILSNGSSKRITEPSSGKKHSKRVDSFREEEKVTIIFGNSFFITEVTLNRIELSSGARVIILSKPSRDTASEIF